MDTYDKLLTDTQNTIGYNESDNKTEFIKGAQVAINKALEFYGKQIESLQLQLMNKDQEATSVLNDMKTLVGIIEKYQEY